MCVSRKGRNQAKNPPSARSKQEKLTRQGWHGRALGHSVDVPKCCLARLALSSFTVWVWLCVWGGS